LKSRGSAMHYDGRKNSRRTSPPQSKGKLNEPIWAGAVRRASDFLFRLMALDQFPMCEGTARPTA
jgi:hypothetical protein